MGCSRFSWASSLIKECRYWHFASSGVLFIKDSSKAIHI
ncbi:hypothetical protein C4K40_3311 [Pseudomonas sp. CMR5c]|nr:hypothetical protein C4K40_3311 [Pseudomonas sp. CMR5c]